MSEIGITPAQYRAGLDKLWDALGNEGVSDGDVFTLSARAIREARAARDANHHSMVLMQKLLRQLLPERRMGCLCDLCIAEEIARIQSKDNVAW